jgi:hypothetical protein
VEGRKMNPEDQIIALAKYHGYKWSNEYIFASDQDEDNGKRKRWRIDHPDGKQQCVYKLLDGLPKYLDDLNETYKLKKRLTKKQLADYCHRLIDMDEIPYSYMMTTAAQESETILRAIGKWKES